MQDQREFLIEVVLRKPNGPFVEDDCRRAALRDVRHGLPDVFEARERRGRHAVVHRHDEGLAVGEDPPDPNLLSSGHWTLPRVLERSTLRMSAFYLFREVGGDSFFVQHYLDVPNAFRPSTRDHA